MSASASDGATWRVYVDLARPLTPEERCAVSEALQELVPDGGCVGRQNGPNDEVYFGVNAETAEDAQLLATTYVDSILERTRLARLGYEVHVEHSTR